MASPLGKRSQRDSDDSRKAPRVEEIASFPIHPLSKYHGNCAVYKQPVELQSYSIDHERSVHFDDRQLKYYLPADLSDADLSVGYKEFIQRDPELKEHIDTLLDALTIARSKNEDPNATKADIVTWRGLITKLLCVPYAKDPFELGATLFNNTIYLEEHETEFKRSQNQGQNDRQQLMGYWGYKFETLSTVSKFPLDMTEADKEEMKSRKGASANTNEQYCTVFKTKLGDNTLIMGAEVDCTSAPKRSDVNPIPNYLELKTSKLIETGRDKHIFERHKMLKFWAQSFLVGTPAVICGFRDNDGNVRKIQKLKTLEMPRMVRGQHGMWDARVCLNFADQFLSWLQNMITIDDPEHTYTITFEHPFQEIRIRSSGKKNIFLTKRYMEGQTSDRIGGPRVGE
ncbi:hypothetical protein INT44_009205 [Umbelopsis vinacea]|uniref:Decapping nuclease n=1 Tax=Umbelopsis vinacea TaxID=44442 RepID=A0A8H7UIC5_9FUNG|nr:hypothetical protein INT44_009205 [Umbelopsis vinacea]